MGLVLISGGFLTTSDHISPPFPRPALVTYFEGAAVVAFSNDQALSALLSLNSIHPYTDLTFSAHQIRII